MSRKLTTPATASANLIDTVESSAQQIWLACLGVLAMARDEGSDIFAALMQEGASLQRRNLNPAKDKGSGVANTVGKLAENVGRQATGSYGRLEALFEKGISRSLRSLKVPMRNDIVALSGQIDELSRSIRALSGRQPVAAKMVRHPRSAKQTAKMAGKPPAGATAKSLATRTAARKVAGKQARLAPS